MNRLWAITVWWALPFAVLIISAGLQVSRGVYFHAFMHDMFVPLEGALHLIHGHLPHRDFASPIGALYFYIHYLPTLVAPLSTTTLIQANLLMAMIVAAVTLWLGRQRLPLWGASVVALYLGMVASSPRQIGEPFLVITNNAAYNRFGWAIIGVLALIAACPPLPRHRRSNLVDGLAVGTLLTALFLTKLTYFGAGVGIICVSLATTRRLADWRFPAAVLGVLAGVLGLVELTTGLIHLYLADVRMAAASSSDMLRPVFAMRLLTHTAWGTIAVLVVGVVGEWDERKSRAWLPRTFLALATVLAGVAIGIQNHPELENPLLPIAALIAGYPFLRPHGSGTPAPILQPATQTFRRACAVAFLGLAAIPLVQDAAAVLWTTAAPHARGVKVDWLDRTPLADLALADVDPSAGPNRRAADVRGDVDLIAVIGNGADLLQRHLRGRRDAIVLPLTFSNPYPVLLGLPPVPHELAWWHVDRSFSLTTKPDGERMLAGVDYVMMPRRYSYLYNSQAMHQAYAPLLTRDFREVDRSADWILLARRNCAARALC